VAAAPAEAALAAPLTWAATRATGDRRAVAADLQSGACHRWAA